MPRSDFNGDGRDDILWRNTNNGNTSNWLGSESGGFFVNDAAAMDPGAPGDLIATGDFNGDGRTDTLWRNNSMEYFLSFTALNGAFQFQWTTGFVAEVGPTWQVIGAGDFDGDGLDDILWASSDGRVSNWLSNGDGTFTINDANAMTWALAEWPVQAIGNFDGIGSDDILVRHANGALDVLFGTEDGGFATDYGEPITQASLDWQIVGVGDFDGDGLDDILWRNTNGMVSNWLSRGDAAFAEFVINDANALRAVSLDWIIVDIGDYNGDGRDDIAWRNITNGAFSNWLANESGGWEINDANAYANAPVDWYIPLLLKGQGWIYDI